MEEVTWELARGLVKTCPEQVKEYHCDTPNVEKPPAATSVIQLTQFGLGLPSLLIVEGSP